MMTSTTSVVLQWLLVAILVIVLLWVGLLLTWRFRPHWLVLYQRYVLNRIFGLFARQVPGLGIVVHTGRKTHRQYRTPLVVFRRPQGYVFALTLGPHTDWVRNVMASGGCDLETRGSTVRLTRPRLFKDEQRRGMPALIRRALGWAHSYDFLELELDRPKVDRPAARP